MLGREDFSKLLSLLFSSPGGIGPTTIAAEVIRGEENIVQRNKHKYRFKCRFMAEEYKIAINNKFKCFASFSLSRSPS